MAKGRVVNIHFPILGLDRSGSYQTQPPYSCLYAQNVRPDSKLELRERGGSRPGLVKAYSDQLGDATNREIVMLNSMRLSKDDGYRRWYDMFEKDTLSDVWSIPSWLSDDPEILPDNIYDLTYTAEGGLIRDAVDDIDTSSPYELSMWIQPWQLDYWGDFRLYARLNNTTPDIETDGIKAELKLPGGQQLLYSRQFSTAAGDGTQLSRSGVDFTDIDGSGTSVSADKHVVRLWPSGANADNGTAGEYEISSVTSSTITLASSAGADATFTGKIITKRGTYEGTLYVLDGGVSTPYTFTSGYDTDAEGGLFKLLINGDSVSVYWKDHTLLDGQDISVGIGAGAGEGVGFSMKATRSDGDNDGVCLADYFAIQYKVSSIDVGYREILVASSGNTLYREDRSGNLTALSPSTDLADKNILRSAVYNQKLYIADWDMPLVKGLNATSSVSGTDLTDTDVADFTAKSIDTDRDVVALYNAQGTASGGMYTISSVVSGKVVLSRDAGSGTVSYRIERAPKVYDPSDDSLTIWETDTYEDSSKKGYVPPGCRLICNWAGRMVLANDPWDPHNWYMSRLDDPNDFDYSQDQDDYGRAVAGNNADAGKVGEPVTALIPFSDDYLLFGGNQTLWIMRGNPAAGGYIDNLSEVAGVVSGDAWCKDAYGLLYFMSLNGLYRMQPGGNAYPEELSTFRLPRELKNIDRDFYRVSMAYDIRAGGIHIFVTGLNTIASEYHWFYDVSSESFNVVTLNKSHEPFCVHSFQTADARMRHVLLGCRDGYIRRFSDNAHTDDGETITSKVAIGPIALNRGVQNGVIDQMRMAFSQDSQDVLCKIYISESAEQAYNQGRLMSQKIFSHGENFSRPIVRGKYAMIWLESNQNWAYENGQMQVTRAGGRGLW